MTLAFAASVAIGQQASESPAHALEDGQCVTSGPCGDVDGSGTLSASDALLTLRAAVGQPETLSCACGGGGTQAACTSAPLLKTGQATCYASFGLTSCQGSKQDGAQQQGVARSFTDNGDGTVSDDVTGLMWEKLSADASIHDQEARYTWLQGFSKVATLNATGFAGYHDWRVPNLVELQTVVNFGATRPAAFPAFEHDCTTGCDGVDCSCFGYSLWSSTRYQGEKPSYAWYVGQENGAPEPIPQSFAFGNVRAVRAGSGAIACSSYGPCGDVNASGKVISSDALAMLRAAVGQEADLVCQCAGTTICTEAPTLKTSQVTCNNGSYACAGTGQDGEFQTGVARSFTTDAATITDNATGLTWEKLEYDYSASIHRVQNLYTWNEAFGKIAALNAVNFYGHNDWRLPNVRELQSLIHFGNRAIQPAFRANCNFPCSLAECSCTSTFPYWTSTTVVSSPSGALAWIVDFTYGTVELRNKANIGEVRAVRDGIQ